MSGFGGIQIIKGTGGLGRRVPSEDANMGIIATSSALPAGMAYGDVKKLIQLKDAEDLGLTVDFDANNDVLIHYHIAEFFRLMPNGTLYITLLADTETAQTVVTKLEAFIKNPIAERKIKSVGIVLNRASSYTPIYTSGIEDDILTAIPQVQSVVDNLAVENIFIDNVLFGSKIETSIIGIQDLRILDSSNVSLVIAQDKAITDVYSGCAIAIGTVLGLIAVRKVCESIGSVDIVSKPDLYLGNPNYSITELSKGLWLSAYLSNGTAVNDLTLVEKKALTTKGYIFAGSYEGYAGIYLNDSPTCVLLSDDYAYIENNRTWNKAARIVVSTLTPRINATVDIDKTTGFINSTTITAWTLDVKKQIGQMLKDEEISGFEFYINPSQNVLGGNPIETQLTILPKGIAREIKATISFTNPLA